jgi:hypothetical protein
VNRRLRAGVFLPAALIAGAADLYFSRRSVSSAEADVAAQKLMLTSLSDLPGKSRMLVSMARQSPGGDLLSDLVRALPGGYPGIDAGSTRICIERRQIRCYRHRSRI